MKRYLKQLQSWTKRTKNDFFSLNKTYAKALDEMGEEARESHQRGESIRLKDLQ